MKGKAYCAISVVPTLAQRTRKNGAPSALVVQAGKASATRRELASMRGAELGWTGGGARLSKQKSPALASGAFDLLSAFRGRGRPRHTLSSFDSGARYAPSLRMTAAGLSRPAKRGHLVHSVHAAAAVTAACWSALLLFRDLRYQGFGRQHQRRD